MIKDDKIQIEKEGARGKGRRSEGGREESRVVREQVEWMDVMEELGKYVWM